MLSLLEAASDGPPGRDPSEVRHSEIHPAKNHFIIVGDTQRTSSWELWREKNDAQRKLIAAEIAKREPAFVIHLGDLTARGSSTKHWEEFNALHEAARQKRIPYFPVLGNHDLYGDDVKALRHYFDRFPHLREKRWYSLQWKKIGFILLDSNFSSLTKGQAASQEKWYIGELERFEKDPDVEHVVVCCHQPPFTNSRVIRPDGNVKTSFADRFVLFRKTRFFFSGHCHSYERFQVGGKSFVVSGGGGGPRHRLYAPGKRPYPDLFPGPELRFFHFIEMESSETGLTLRVVRLELNGTFTNVDPFTASP